MKEPKDPEKKPSRRTVAVRVIEFTEWVPAYKDDKIKVPSGDPFWLTNGVIGAHILEDETLFDVNINDVGVREEIEVSVRGKKEKVMHSLYFFQLLVGRVIDGDAPHGPHHVFRPRPASNLVTPGHNGMPPGGMPGMGGPLRG